jgi:hypothetical protein
VKTDDELYQIMKKIWYGALVFPFFEQGGTPLLPGDKSFVISGLREVDVRKIV